MQSDSSGLTIYLFLLLLKNYFPTVCGWWVDGWMDGWEDTWTETHMDSWSSGVSLLWLTEVRSHVVGSADFPFQSVNANRKRQAAGMLA